MMAGNPNWWSMNNGMLPQSHHQLSSQFVYASDSPTSNPSPADPNGQDFPVRSWSQLLLGGLASNEGEAFGAHLFQQQKKMENWEEQVVSFNPIMLDHVKQEVSQFYGQNMEDYEDDGGDNEFIHHHQHHQVMPVSSPTSCVTTLSNNNIFNFSDNEKSKNQHHNNQDHSYECNSTGMGGASKKARVTKSSVQPASKVKKEKLGERITALHTIVSPFGKTDTASVLSEAIGYIRFLQGQIQALSNPYMRNASGRTRHHQLYVQEKTCLFPDEPGQLLNGLEGPGASKQEAQGRSGPKDMRSRGLCLVPISCTKHVGNENGPDYWAPAPFGSTQTPKKYMKADCF